MLGTNSVFRMSNTPYDIKRTRIHLNTPVKQNQNCYYSTQQTHPRVYNTVLECQPIEQDPKKVLPPFKVETISDL